MAGHMANTHDLVAIGSGHAGESATDLAAFLGHRSPIIEKAQPWAVTNGQPRS